MVEPMLVLNLWLLSGVVLRPSASERREDDISVQQRVACDELPTIVDFVNLVGVPETPAAGAWDVHVLSAPG